jgi:hypothetical protein
MPVAIEKTLQVLQAVVQRVPVGTNLALLHLMWAILNGSFLGSRGAIFPALLDSGFSEEEIRRSWQAMRYGAWSIDELLEAWRCYVQQQGEWQTHEYEGYRCVAVDLTAFWRLRLKGWMGKYFNGIANRMLKGIGFALVVEVGHLAGQRLPLLRKILRADATERSQKQLQRKALSWVGENLAEDEVLVFDAGAHISELEAASVKGYVLRLAANCTARRNELPEYLGRGRRPQYGQRVRPLPRQRKGKTIEATAPDFEVSFEIDGRTIRAQGWQNLVRSELKVDPAHRTFSIWVFFDPLYTDPLVLGTDLDLQPLSLLNLYQDRWPVEQVPLVAKQMLGLHRQFVFAPESCQRLPELAMLVGNILSYLALVLPAMPTGFWDRRPQKTTGRLRRVLARFEFPTVALSDGRIRKKNSVTAHLPKGIVAHRRQKQSEMDPPLAA